jgi:hypothetical protein
MVSEPTSVRVPDVIAAEDLEQGFTSTGCEVRSRAPAGARRVDVWLGLVIHTPGEEMIWR